MLGRICQVIGYAMVLVPMVPLAFAINVLLQQGAATATLVTAVFSLPWLGVIAAGVLMLVAGQVLIEVQEIREHARRTAALLEEIASARK